MEGLVSLIALTCVLVCISCTVYIMKSIMQYFTLKINQIVDVTLSEKDMEKAIEKEEQ